MDVYAEYGLVSVGLVLTLAGIFLLIAADTRSSGALIVALMPAARTTIKPVRVDMTSTPNYVLERSVRALCLRAADARKIIGSAARRPRLARRVQGGRYVSRIGNQVAHVLSC